MIESSTWRLTPDSSREIVMVPCRCLSAPLTRTLARDGLRESRLGAGSDPSPTPAAEPRLGAVVFRTHKGERAEAVLDHRGRWRCPALPVLDRVLNALYEPGREPAGAQPFGLAEMLRVAAWLKGEVRRP
jgi:hypothetical protein